MSEAPQLASPASKPRDRVRVLMVEDNPGDVRLMTEEIRQCGDASRFELTDVPRLEEALACLGKQSFDAILLNISLPDAQGLEAIVSIVEAAPGLPVLVLSGLADQSLALQALKEGAQDYLVKGRDDGGLVTRAILYAIERKRSERYINHLAHYDGLTNIPNRRLMYDRLRQAIARSRRDRKMVAILFLDLDHFKNINDTLGHAAGDLLLSGVASRLSGITRSADTVARLGGDEFALIIPEIVKTEHVATLAGKILETLRPPFMVEGHELNVSASMGISLYPADGSDAETLLKNADVAMYGAKQRGRNNHQFYSPLMNAAAVDRLALARTLQHALDRDEFLLHYQPQFSLKTNRVIGVEALLRWQSPTAGLLGPPEFIPLAEETGLIVPIGEWAIHEACQQLREWQDMGMRRLRVAVNLSSRQFNREDLRDTLRSILKSTRVSSELLELELTENGLMQNMDSAAHALARLKDSGVRIAIDDFGTGYSSLTHLKRFPIDTLKIDQSFVSHLATQGDDAAIGKAIITMAHGLGLEVIAEGVETEAQLEFLRRNQCDGAQGYYFCSPRPAPAVVENLRVRGSRERGAAPGMGTR